MAELIVGGALLYDFLNVLFDRMASQDLNFFHGKKVLSKLLDELKIRLLSANKLLNDAEVKQLTDENVKKWLDELKEVLYEANRVMEALRRKVEGDQFFLNSISTFFSASENTAKSEIEEILSRFKILLDQKDVLGLRDGVQTRPSQILLAPLAEESDVYGRDADKEAIFKLLLSDDAGGHKISVIGNLTSLDFRSDEEVTLILGSLSFHSQLGNLKSLGMEFWSGEFSNLELLSHCHVLSRLSLTGQLSAENITYLPKSLVELRLSCCSFDQEKIEVMEKLPNLRMLEFSYDGNDTEYKLVFSVGGFPKLELLRLSSLSRFVEWEVEKCAMPNLKRLDIEEVDRLRMIPEGLKHVTTLRELNISRMPKKFEHRLRVNEDGIEGEDFYKVRQIPFITFFYDDDIESARTSNSEWSDQYSQFTDDVES